MNYELSIIIPLYNSEKTILDSIDSIESEKIKLNYEVIIVDDCSTDNGYSLVKKHIENLSNYKLLKNHKNLGGGATRNIAIKNVSSNIIYCLDSDNMIGEKSIENMFYFLKKNELDAVTVEYSNRFYDKITNGFFKWEFDKYKGDLIPFEAIFSLNKCPLNITFMHTKKVFEVTGGYPENHGFDTQHFAIRFLMNNLKAKVCSGAFDYHRLHRNKGSYYHREYFSGKSNYNWLNIYSEMVHFFDEKTFETLVNFNLYDTFELSLNQKITKDNLVENHKKLIKNHSRDHYKKTLKSKKNLSLKELYFLFHYEKDLLKSLDYGIQLYRNFENSIYLEKKIIEIFDKLGLEFEKFKNRSFRKITLFNRVLNRVLKFFK